MFRSSSPLRMIAIVIAALLVGYFVLAITIDRVFATSIPRLALFWNPGSADANVAAADLLLQRDVKDFGSQTEQLALRAARRDPTNPGAPRVLAVEAAARGQDASALRLLGYAEQVSRRDLPTELLLIETSVAKGDVAGALLHYDRAMRVQRSSWPVLFPVLAHAADERSIWQPLSVILSRRPVWWRDFMDEVATHTTSPDALYALTVRSGSAHPNSPEADLVRSIELRLLDLKAYQRAFDLYRRSHGLRTADALIRNGDFEEAGGGDPFDWNLADDPDLSAERAPDPTSGGNALFLTAANGRGGDLATQTLVLQPGHYEFAATSGNVDGDPLSFPQLALRCLGSDTVVLSATLPVAPRSGRRWAETFTIPPGCNAQRLTIRMNGNPDGKDAAPWIDAIVLKRLGGS